MAETTTRKEARHHFMPGALDRSERPFCIYYEGGDPSDHDSYCGRWEHEAIHAPAPEPAEPPFDPTMKHCKHTGISMCCYQRGLEDGARKPTEMHDKHCGLEYCPWKERRALPLPLTEEPCGCGIGEDDIGVTCLKHAKL